MNAPDRKLLALDIPGAIRRAASPAHYGWWSNRTLQIIKGDDVITLDADDIRALLRFINQFDMEVRP